MTLPSHYCHSPQAIQLAFIVACMYTGIGALRSEWMGSLSMYVAWGLRCYLAHEIPPFNVAQWDG